MKGKKWIGDWEKWRVKSERWKVKGEGWKVKRGLKVKGEKWARFANILVEEKKNEGDWQSQDISISGWDWWGGLANREWVESADSISATMKEGYYRNQKGDLRKFFQYSFSSAKEAEHWLWKSYNRKLVNEIQYNELKQKFQDYFPQTVNFITNIDK